MRVGVQLPEVERVVGWTEIAAMARAAEASPFESVWLGDHLLYRGDGKADRGPWDAWTQLAALAAITTRVALGPLVAATAFHPPGLIARMAASIDEISGGRFVLGIGAGWNEPEFAAFGFPFDRLASRFEESFAIVHRLLAGERVSFDGEYQHVRDAVLLPKPARAVPVMIGSNGPRVLRAALPHAAWWNAWYSWYGNTADGLAVRNAEIDALCREVGRDRSAVRRSACVLVSFGAPSERTHEAPAVPVARLGEHLRELAGAGADEAILVLDPVNEETIRAAGERIG
jgi:alkanesulfonate monooxygenase SsuD/methylene tetrahydromethanopterin reductase-like flavin-dependent oxidoreductase (luciferase family)